MDAKEFTWLQKSNFSKLSGLYFNNAVFAKHIVTCFIVAVRKSET